MITTQDFMGVYSCETWELAAHFPLESYDCVEIGWSPDNSYASSRVSSCARACILKLLYGFRCIAVRDSHLEFRVLLYSPNGELLANYKVRQQRPSIEVKAVETDE
jgi:hypothetical protein